MLSVIFFKPLLTPRNSLRNLKLNLFHNLNMLLLQAILLSLLSLCRIVEAIDVFSLLRCTIFTPPTTLSYYFGSLDE